MRIKSLLAGLLALAGFSIASAVPHADWVSNPEYFDVNSLAGSVVDGNTPGGFSYKFDVPGTESGPLADLFTTVISDDGLSALVTWSPVGSVDLDDVYLKTSAQYIVWDVSGVNWSLYSGFYVSNTEIMNNPGTAFRAISHIQINGEPGTNVPDGGLTAILLGLGLAGVGSFRRFVRR